MTIAHLRVCGVLDLQPRRDAAIRAVRAMRPLRHDALEITIARGAKQIASAPFDVIQVQQPGFNRGHDAEQPLLAFQQWQARDVSALDAQHVERIEVRPLAAE